MFIIDAHLDLAMNVMEWNRNLKLPVREIREREAGLSDKPDRGKNMVSLPALREGKIGLVVATQIARFVRKGSTLPGWHSPEQAWSQTQAQLAWYRTMTEEGEMVQIRDADTLEAHIKVWEDETVPDQQKPVGFMLSLEGADSLVDLSYLDKAHAYGLRALGPAHYGEGRYAGGTGTEDGFSAEGKALLKKMESLNIILDITHLTDKGFNEAMDIFNGNIWASHHNCRALVKNQRQLTDEQIKILIEKKAVIGGVLDAWMLTDGWLRGVSLPKATGTDLNRLINHYDHICQIAGNSDHIAIGSDLDGMFGTEQSPYDMNTIADLQKLPSLLKARGYVSADIEKILHGNWLRFLRNAWKKK
ncbi:MAG TPA: membrane dipeptidase [Puia sp.]|nr:membrane dipeptidase [Puia sp.]